VALPSWGSATVADIIDQHDPDHDFVDLDDDYNLSGQPSPAPRAARKARY
jgi:hypothetical protein